MKDQEAAFSSALSDAYRAFSGLLKQTKNHAVPRWGLILFGHLLSGVALACLVIHFFIKDRLDILSLVYYVTPLPVLVAVFFLLSLMWLLGKRVQYARFYVILAIGCLIVWTCKSLSLNAAAASPRNVKLFFWNTGNNKWKAGEIASHIHSFDADLIGIVESGFRRKLVDTTWRPLFSNYTVEALPHEMALITRGKILTKESGALGGRSYFNLLEVDLDEERFHVLLVDINGSPLVPRSRALQRLAEIIHTYAQRNLIVMGDFNTPLDSVFFESFRPYLHDAFESGGTGFAETWPIPVPVLNIDHIWVSKKIQVTGCNLNWSWLSDHRSVLATIAPSRN